MGFIIDDPESCTRCGRVLHPDGAKVTWTCQVCRKLVCRDCALKNPSGEILWTTYCSEDCRLVMRVERRLENPEARDDDD